VIALTDPASFGPRSPLAWSINLLSLGLLVWGVTTEAHLGLGGRHVWALIALVLATAGWVGWLACRYLDRPATARPALVLMGLAGGALTPFAPLGLVYVGVAALAASLSWEVQDALWIALSGPAAMAVALPAAGHNVAPLGAGAAAMAAGAAMGISRRQSTQATTRAAEMQVAEARADAERARAELLAGRNHMARELHDVLAHTLSALSLQLEAFDALINSGRRQPDPEVAEQLAVTKRLVRSGLDEARGAVRALREDPPPLPDQLAGLAGDRGVAFEITGATRVVDADVSLALYRVAQEALTNVVKHAPGAPAEISLVFGAGEVTLSVTNGPPALNGSALAHTGGGYGIQGIKERVLLLGGRVEAGPTVDGWRVLAAVPG
jgi:signal transduction histidine kinase